MKNLRVEPVENSALVRIAYEGGGEVPDKLKGKYTSPAAALEAIRVWKFETEREVEVTIAREEEERSAQEKAKGK